MATHRCGYAICRACHMLRLQQGRRKIEERRCYTNTSTGVFILQSCAIARRAAFSCPNNGDGRAPKKNRDLRPDLSQLLLSSDKEDSDRTRASSSACSWYYTRHNTPNHPPARQTKHTAPENSKGHPRNTTTGLWMAFGAVH